MQHDVFETYPFVVEKFLIVWINHIFLLFCCQLVDLFPYF